jgi:hypothetical protein
VTNRNKRSIPASGLGWLRVAGMVTCGIAGVFPFTRPLIAQGAQSQPLGLGQIQRLIQLQAPDATIAAEIRRRGLSFTPDRRTVEALRGAGPETLQAIDELRPMLDEAKLAIPQTLTKIYQALDQGNPQAIGPFVSPEITSRTQALDAVCRPFTYKAHYVETIIERPGRKFEARVRVLFKPFDEKAQVFTFHPNRSTFVLIQVGNDPLTLETEAAKEVVRQFVFAVRAGKWDVASRYASPHLPIDKMKAPEWAQYFDKITGAQVDSVQIIADHGILLLVRVDVRSYSAHLPDFLVDPATGLIVRAFFRARENIFTKLPDPTGFTDPDIEASILKRFGLVGPKEP